MKTYSDLQDIDQFLCCELKLRPIGTPEVEVVVGNQYGGGKLFQTSTLKFQLPLVNKFFVQLELKNKVYDINHETAIIIDSLKIDGIELMPRFNYMALYVNDHNNNDPTSYLGFNGKWTLTFDRPFYQWLHQATGQGWLLS